MSAKTNGTARRAELLSMLRTADEPISGTALAGHFNVSRQVIVQDVALLRASDAEIFSTPKGYILYQSKKETLSRRFYVSHSGEEMEEEMNMIVDMGGRIKDVIVIHPVYGELRGELNLSSRLDVAGFLDKIHSQKGIPLLEISNGRHIHTIEAPAEEILDRIHQKLAEIGFLISE